MDLHYSQTKPPQPIRTYAFESPMDLHYSQTTLHSKCYAFVFESPMDLHYSQTMNTYFTIGISLNPLWIYTTLKHE